MRVERLIFSVDINGINKFKDEFESMDNISIAKKNNCVFFTQNYLRIK